MKFLFFSLALLTYINNLFSNTPNTYQRSVSNTNTFLRGNEALAKDYKQHQKNMYFIVNQPDVDTECRKKIYNCLSEYCGDITIVNTQRDSRCNQISEGELYNYTLLCLQKDKTVLLPQYENKNGSKGMNTASRLCPSYVQEELMSFLSMSNLATQLNKSRSNLCIKRRQELEAALSCHSVALAYSNETTSMLNSQLTEACGSGVAGGSSEMVSRFLNAGNVGSNIWGWADKIVSMEINKKGNNWQTSIDNILSNYTNRMNLACGDNMQLNLNSNNNNVKNVHINYPILNKQENISNIWYTITSLSDIYDYPTAKQIIQAGLTNTPFIKNDFLTSSDIDNIQKAYKNGVKAFIIKDNTRCFIIEVSQLTSKEKSLMSQAFVNCHGS